MHYKQDHHMDIILTFPYMKKGKWGQGNTATQDCCIQMRQIDIKSTRNKANDNVVVCKKGIYRFANERSPFFSHLQRYLG